MPIEIEGYEVLVPNEIYAKPSSIHILSENGIENTEGRKIVTLARYTEPTQDHIVEYIQRQAREVATTPSIIIPGRGEARNYENPIQGRIASLPPGMQVNLRGGDDKIIDFIRKASPVGVIEGGAADNFLRISVGALLNDLFEAEKDRLTEKGREALQEMGENFLLSYTVKMKLDGESLPNHNDVDTLLRHGVYRSNTLSATTNYHPEELLEIFNGVYKGFEYSAMNDISPQVVGEYAEIPVIELQNYVVSLMQRARR